MINKHYVTNLNGSLTQYKRFDNIKDKSNRLRYSMRSKADNDNLKDVDSRLKAIFNKEFGSKLK